MHFYHLYTPQQTSTHLATNGHHIARRFRSAHLRGGFLGELLLQNADRLPRHEPDGELIFSQTIIHSRMNGSFELVVDKVLHTLPLARARTH